MNAFGPGDLSSLRPRFGSSLTLQHLPYSFRILITGDTSGLVETIVDSVSVHSIKKAEYARRVAKGSAITHVSLYEHFVNVRRLFPLGCGLQETRLGMLTCSTRPPPPLDRHMATRARPSTSGRSATSLHRSPATRSRPTCSRSRTGTTATSSSIARATSSTSTSALCCPTAQATWASRPRPSS